MELERKQKPEIIRFQEDVFAHRSIVRVITWLITPALIVLMVYSVLSHNWAGLSLLSVIFLINATVLTIERLDIAKQTKLKINGFLFKLQVFSFGIFLLAAICIANQWFFSPWSFVFCYLAFLILGLKAGTLCSAILFTGLLSAYLVKPDPPEIISADWMLRFYAAFFIITVFMACAEYVRNKNRRRLDQAHLRLLASQKNYRRLNKQLETEIIGHKTTQAALKESEAVYRMMAENVADVIWTMNMQLAFTYVSPSIYKQRGFTAQEVMAQPIEQVTLAESLDKALKLLDKQLALVAANDPAGFEPVYLELQQPCKDGSLIWTGNHVRILADQNGKPAGIIGVSRDLTERKQGEEALRQAQKMEAIGILAGGIAHDFNNILSPIIGMSELQLDDLKPGSLEYQNTQAILEAGLRGRDLVTQILAFSRESTSHRLPVRFQQILQEVLKLIRATLPANINIKQDIQPDCGAIEANPGKMHQIAMNLFTNAYQAIAPEGGWIAIVLKETEVDEETGPGDKLAPGRYIHFSISDTGSGIKPAIEGKIFEPYFTTKEKAKGTGLGLAVVYGIVKEHGGQILVKSEWKKGTRFDVYLPLMVQPPDMAPAVTAETVPKGNSRILVVDDEDAVAQIEKQMLEHLGYVVTSRTSSVEALRDFRSDPDAFEMVITDMMMPTMTGDQLALELLAIKPGLPVILCTGFNDNINAEKAETIGLKGFLMKPIVYSKLARLVRKVLDEANPATTCPP